MILADLLQRQLSDNGIHDLYTIPGDFILPWLGAWSRDNGNMQSHCG